MTLSFALSMTLALALLLPALASAQAIEPRPSIPDIPLLTVSGEGESSAAPDRATVRVGAAAQEREASAAQQRVNKIVEDTLKRIDELGVPKAQVRTSGLSLRPVYTDQPRPQPMRGDQPQEPRIAGYRASNVVEVTLDDLTLVGKVIDAGVASGANQLEGLTFDLKDPTNAQQEALAKAVKIARAKAQSMAEALGIELGQLHEAIEGSARHIPFQPMMAGRFAAMEVATPVQPGEVNTQASVTLRYRIGNAK